MQGNLKPMWHIVCALMDKGFDFDTALTKAMQVYLAGVESRHWIQKELYADIPCGHELPSPDRYGNIEGGGI